MIEVNIPGWGKMKLEHLLTDFTGTLSVDGKLQSGVGLRLKQVAQHLQVHVVTADTFGRARAELAGLPCALEILAPGREDEQKLARLRQLGAVKTAVFGNGRNDRLILGTARLGVAVCLAEGCAAEALRAAQLLVRSAADAFDLLLEPRRLVASLRR